MTDWRGIVQRVVVL